jgi:hypothetical protein
VLPLFEALEHVFLRWLQTGTRKDGTSEVLLLL